MKEIIYISSDSNRTGGPVHINTLVKGLKDKYKITVVSSNGWLSEKMKENNIGWKEIDIKLSNFFEFRKFFKDHPNDVLHFQGMKAGGIARLASIGLPNKKIYTEHLWTQEYYEVANYRKYYQLLILAIFSMFTDKTVAVSDSVKKFLVSKRITSSSKIVRIYNGVEIPIIKKRSKDLVKIGVIGSLSPSKNFRILLPLVKQFKNINLLIVGQGELKSDLKREVKELDIEDSVEFKKEMDVEEFYSGIDIFIQTSLHESFGLALVEALVSGVPVLASNLESTKEILHNSAYTFQKDNPEELKNKLELLLNNLDKEKQYFQSQTKDYISKFSSRRMIDEYIDLYQSLNI